MSFIDGLSSGLDTSAIISQLMQIERRPQVALDNRRTQEESARTELSGIRSDINALRTMAADLRLASGWNRVTATSSDPDAVTVQATSASTSGSTSFRVTELATAASVYSSSTYSSTNEVVAAPTASVFTTSGHQSLGFESLSGSGFSQGDIAFSVVQDSAAAEVEGAGIPAIPIEIDGTNDDIDFEVDGFSFSVTLSHGIYNSEAALAEALQAAIADNATAAAQVAAGLTGDHRISLSTLGEGSARSLTITGGDAMAGLGFSLGQSATGTDGIVEVDGVQTAITDTTAGTEVVLASGGAGSITATIGGPIRSGTADVSQEGFGSGTLSELVSTINDAGLGYTAAAVNTGNGYRLQLTADETGAASAFTPDPEAFVGIDFTVLSAGTDAELTVEGTNPFTIASSTNTFESLLPGVDVTVHRLTDNAVTVSSERDIAATTESVQSLVDKMNEVLERIASATTNQPGTDSVLRNNREARRAADQLRNALVEPVDTSTFGSVGVVGIELTREGKLSFDADGFKEAFASDPVQMTKLFTDSVGGTEAPGALDRLVEAAEQAAAAGTGYLHTASQASDRRIEDFGRQIEAFEQRFVAREANLRRTFANLEVALSGLQQQSGYLASQLSSLGGT
jgi:flagellar hook-associated protein 2